MAQRMARGPSDGPNRRTLATAGNASPDNPPIGADELFAWAQWKYPELFPGAPATQTITYQGVLYEVRAYANGNYLGVTPDGQIYGLGPFTSQALQGFGRLPDFAVEVSRVYCQLLYSCYQPQMVVDASDAAVSQGHAASFSVETQSNPKPHYQWQVSLDQGQRFVDIPGATSPQFTSESVAISDTGRQYRVRVGNAAGWVTSREVLLTVTTGDLRNYFPTQAGSWWKYFALPTRSTDVVRVEGVRLINGQSVVTFGSTDGWTGEVSQDMYAWASDGVRSHEPDSADAASRALDGVKVLHLPFQPGVSLPQVDATVASGRDFDGDGVEDHVHIVGTMTMVAMEDVKVVAGFFGATMHMRQTFNLTYQLSGIGQSVDGLLLVDEWYADGVGLVKRESRARINGSEEITTQSLSEFQVGARSTNSIAPVVRSVSPAGGSLSAARDGVTVTFNKPIDPGSIGADTLVVKDQAGQRVVGTLVPTFGEANEVFRLNAAPLPSGHYTAILNNDPRDTAGRALLFGKTWTFDVDANGPSVVSTEPAMGAVDVALQPRITLQYSEALGDLRQWQGYIRLTLDSEPPGSLGMPVEWSVQGSALTIWPSAPLASGSQYRLEVNAIDRWGNGSISPVTLAFRTRAGMFLPKVPVSGLPVELLSSATQSRLARLADMNGDGLLDLVLVGGDGAGAYAGKLIVAFGRGHGVFGNVVLPTTNLGPNCQISSLAVGDLANAGRSGIVVGSRDCGARWLRETPGGGFAPAESLIGAHTEFMTILPLTRSASPGLIGAGRVQGAAFDSLAVWQHDASGVWREGTTLEVEGLRDGLLVAGDVASGPVGLVLADMNKDGRLDVVTLHTLNPTPFVAQGMAGVLLQLPNGTLGTESLQTLQITGPLLVGDVTGDGRPDILAGLELLQQLSATQAEPGKALARNGQRLRGAPKRSMSRWLGKMH